MLLDKKLKRNDKILQQNPYGKTGSNGNSGKKKVNTKGITDVKTFLNEKIYIDGSNNNLNNHIFQCSSLPYLILEANGAIKTINRAGEELLKKSAEEISVCNFKEFVSADSVFLIDNLLSNALLSDKKEICETVLIVDGNHIPVHITASIIPASFECLFEIIDLTPQQTIQTLAANELSLRTLVNEASVGIFIADLQGNYISVNQHGCDMLGYTLPELLKINIKDVLVANETSENPIAFQKLLMGFHVFSERNMVRKDGTTIPVEISGKILSDGRLQGIVRDLSRQKEAEKALLESEVNYRHAESIAHLGSWQMDIKTGKSRWSDEFFRICGYEPQEFEPTRVHRYQVVHPEDRKKSEQAIQMAISQKSSYKIEKRVLRPNGEVRHVLSLGEIILDKNNEPAELKGVFLDITDLKKVEISLKKSEEKYRTLSEFLPIGLLIQNKNREIVYYNKKSEELLDIDFRNLKETDKNLNVVRKDGSWMPMNEFPGTKALLEERTVENVEMGIVSNHRKIWLNVTAAPMPGNEEVIVAFVDITEKVSREKELKELSEKLQELNATKDKFFSIIAHDLKNPFNSILGFSDLLLKNLKIYSLEETERFVGIIHSTSQQTYDLLENLLLWSRSQTGTLEYYPDLFNLDALVAGNIEFIRPMAIKKQIKVNFKSSADHYVLVDKNMLDTVLRNILTNALKFSYINGSIDVSVNESEKSYVISIRDYGIGIGAENLSKLFRLDSKFTVVGTNKEKGSGLGLLICKEFIEKNQGEIWATSELGKGTEFHISIPGA